MPRLKNHEVWIESDGERYEEYETKVEGDVVTCYIASQIDKLFEIKWADHNVPILISSAIYFDVDGVRLDGQANFDIPKHKTITSRGYRSDSTSFLPYKFSHVALTDDDAAFAPSNDMGTICVNVHRVVIGEPTNPTFLTLPDGFQKPLSERAKKMGSHRIGFGEVEKAAAPPRHRKIFPYQNEVGPYVSFRFLYRPKDVLQALEIIPATLATNKRPATTSPVPGSSNPETERNRKRKRRSPNSKADQEIDLSDDDEEERELLASSPASPNVVLLLIYLQPGNRRNKQS
ncbi:hypothetical protein M0805_007618 [Coniferiporia weirii]|nr:hypothetical protein M0805_007618 [Coniferiporia weirii]